MQSWLKLKRFVIKPDDVSKIKKPRQEDTENKLCENGMNVGITASIPARKIVQGNKDGPASSNLKIPSNPRKHLIHMRIKFLHEDVYTYAYIHAVN